ncbi:unnamed protein product, partial [Allacma fusca]
ESRRSEERQNKYDIVSEFIKKLLPEVGFEPTPSFEDRNLSPTP